MIKKKYKFLVFLTLLVGLGITYQSNSQPRPPAPNPRTPPQPIRPQPIYRAPVPVVAPATPRVVPWGRIISLQYALDYYRPLRITILEFLGQPSYYYGKYITWKGVIINTPPQRYFVNIPNESAFYFKVVNPNLKNQRWSKNQTVTVVGMVDKLEDSQTVLGIHKHIPNVEAYYVEKN